MQTIVTGNDIFFKFRVLCPRIVVILAQVLCTAYRETESGFHGINETLNIRVVDVSMGPSQQNPRTVGVASYSLTVKCTNFT